MSRNPVSVALVDLLLTAAIKWGDPDRPWSYYWHRTGGRPVSAETADRIGSMLLGVNWEATEGSADSDVGSDGDGSRYRFYPLLGIPDPLVVLQQIAYYQYQTAGDRVRAWLTSEPYAFLNALASAAQARIPGIEEVPWGVEDNDRDIFLRRGGEDPRDSEPDYHDDPHWLATHAELAATGIPFESAGRGTLHSSTDGIGRRDEVGVWTARWPAEPSVPAVFVHLLASERAAQIAYDARLQGIRQSYDSGADRDCGLMRRGRVVVRLLRQGLHPATQWHDRVIQMFADAEDRWIRDNTPRPLVSAEVIADRVALSPAGEGMEHQIGGAALVARDAHGRRQLAAMVEDPELQLLIQGPKLDGKTVILFSQIGSVEVSGEAELIDLGRLSTQTVDTQRLRIFTSRVGYKTGSLLVVDTQSGPPDKVFLTGHVLVDAIDVH